MVSLRRVQGTSMAPALLPGEVVLIRQKPVQAGDIVVALLGGQEVVKRVRSIAKEAYYLVGDNALESTDSRELGPVKKGAIKGVVFGSWPVARSSSWSGQSRLVALLLAAIVLVMAVTQLVRFDNFIPVLAQTLEQPLDLLVGALAVTLEVFALPFLLGMSLSPLARAASLTCGWLVTLLWITLGFYIGIGNSGLLGSFIAVPGMAAVMVGLALLFGLAYLTWRSGKRGTAKVL